MSKRDKNRAVAQPEMHIEQPVATESEHPALVEMGKITLLEGENKSQAIRRLTAEGMTTGQIAKALGVRYQHVYNVQKRPLKGRGTDA